MATEVVTEAAEEEVDSVVVTEVEVADVVVPCVVVEGKKKKFLICSYFLLNKKYILF